MSQTSTSSSPRDNRAARILANSLFQDMRQNGYECGQILALATELIDLVTRDMGAPATPSELASKAPAAQALRSVG